MVSKECRPTWSLVVSLVVMLTTTTTTINGQYNSISLTFEAETGLGFSPDNVHWRSRATGPNGEGEPGQAVWLPNDGDMISFAICMPRAEEVQVEKVIYSTDGWAKEGAVRIDREEVGSFYTEDNSNYGHSWNDFHTAEGPYEPLYLSEGPHIIDVVLKHSMDNDPWGIEVDKIVMWFGSHFTVEQLRCPGYDEGRQLANNGRNETDDALGGIGGGNLTNAIGGNGENLTNAIVGNGGNLTDAIDGNLTNATGGNQTNAIPDNRGNKTNGPL